MQKAGNRRRINVSLPEDLVRKLKVFASNHLVSMQAACEQLLRRGLEARTEATK